MDMDDKGLGFPLRLGPHRGLDVVAIEESVRAMLEQILFTAPGERVNRPTFGVGVQHYVFEPNSPLLANRIRIALDENVYTNLGKSVRVLNVSVGRDEEQLHVHVAYEIVGIVSSRKDLEVVVPARSVP
ncbi:GPW/gp25 family protein [Sorangium sp. So ce861]|uniref:GPW/gp25 family protein n=1 Tax=Sorangium sp. So ce861 TaxID=3133323 RepID=UPI003F5DC55B